MLHSFRWLAFSVSQPKTGCTHDVQFAFQRQAVVARFVVRTRSFHGAIVLGHMEIEGPRPEGGRNGLERSIESVCIVPIEVMGQDFILWRV